MTNQDKIYSREMALHEFEVSVDIYLRCGLTNEDIIALIKKKHVETSAKLEKNSYRIYECFQTTRPV